MTLEGTPDIVSPAGVAGLEFLDEAETANRYARELRRAHGVEAIVVLLHEGGLQSAPAASTTATAMSGPIVRHRRPHDRRPSTCSSPATPTRPTTARSTAGR